MRARFVALNGEPVTADTYAGADPQTRRRAQREFNLSMASSLGDDNRVTGGRFWNGTPSAPEFSVEENFARQLGWSVGDRVTFDIAAQRVEAPVTSLRAVEWESFRPNFFVLASPGALDGYPASWITAVSVLPERPRFTAELVERFPNLSVIDIDAVLTQVRATADQVSVVVQAVFWFSLLAGVLVLLAAVALALGWRPSPSPLHLLVGVVAAVLAIAAFALLGLALSGSQRPEVTLGLANLIYLVGMALGLLVPLSRFPGWAQPLVGLLPTSALGEALRTGAWLSLPILLAWCVGGLLLARKVFRWTS